MNGDPLDRAGEVVREVASASKALRLYPAASPIPRQSAESAAEALAGFFEMAPALLLTVTKDGFGFMKQPVDVSSAGASDLARVLQSHGIAAVTFSPGCSPDDLIEFLGIAIREPEAVKQEGGVSALLAAAGIETITVADVHLTVVDLPAEAEDQEVDEFLRELATDADKLTAWFSAASKGDPAALEDSLAELAGVAGASGRSDLVDSLSAAFLAQDSDGRDSLLELALGDGAARDVAQSVIGGLDTDEVASSVCGGSYGDNMLSLSTALTALPLAERFASIMAQVREILPTLGHDPKELDFLDNMIEARKSGAVEPALVESDLSYQKVAEAARVTGDELEEALLEVADSRSTARARSVTTMLSLLDQQRDFGFYCKTLDTLAATVPRLIGSGDLEQARRVLDALEERETRADQPWPELTDRIRKARDHATDASAMGSLLAAVLADGALADPAQDLVQAAGDRAPSVLVQQALARQEDGGLEAAEDIVGRRFYDLLAALAGTAPWSQLSGLVSKLASHGEARSAQAVATAVARSDENARREAAKGLAASTDPALLDVFARLLADSSPEVTVTAARSLAKSGLPGGAPLLGARLGALDVDGKDFPVARELIGILAGMPDSSAREALQGLAGRKVLIKRGHFAEVQDLAARALAAQEKEAGR